jgi:hypothetical protein
VSRGEKRGDSLDGHVENTKKKNNNKQDEKMNMLQGGGVEI